MSVQELRQRIAEIDSEIITAPKALFKQLERDRSLFQRQLNNVLDPLARLPPEISSQIFLQCLPPFPNPHHGTSARHVPTLLLSICNTWTEIALSTPVLWAAISIVFPCPNSWKKILPIWLQRARNHPLSISLEVGGGDDFDEDIAAIVWQHRPQLKHLDLYDHWWEDSEDILPSASPGQLPALETLTMRGEGCFRRYSPELLQLAPNLIECRIYFSDAFFDMGNVVLPNLRRLTFGEPGTCPRGGDVDALKCLSLPKLEALRIGTSSGALVTFLKDSCPPLRELSIQIGDAALDFVALAEYVPLITRLEVWFLKHLVVENLFAALTSQPLLLHLHILTIHVAPQYLPQNTSTFWTALTRALAARRTHIQVFRLTVRDRFRASQMPAPNILAAFRELAADGMHVSIGATWGKWSLFDNISLSEA